MTNLDELVELRQTSDEAVQALASPRSSLALKNILVPTDLSVSAKKAVNYAVALAEHFGAKLTLLYVDTMPYMMLTSAVHMGTLLYDDIVRITWKH